MATSHCVGASPGRDQTYVGREAAGVRNFAWRRNRAGGGGPPLTSR
jgi:hypothetical protein